jgi:hypothetical protein
VQAAHDAVLASLPELISKVMAAPTPAGHGLVARLAAAYPDDEQPFADGVLASTSSATSSPTFGQRKR